MKLIEFSNNFLAILAIFGLFVVSLITTVALSPIGIGADQSRVAGITEAAIISNPKPLEFDDISIDFEGFEGQLVMNEQEHGFNVVIGPLTDSNVDMSVIRIINPNTVDMPIEVSGFVASELAKLVDVNVSDLESSLRVHDSEFGNMGMREFVIPANSETNLSLEIELEQPLNFKSQISVSISY